MSDAELQKIEQLINVWRSRLYNISRFMSRLNYTIALQLMSFAERAEAQREAVTLSPRLKDFLELVDWTGRVIRGDEGLGGIIHIGGMTKPGKTTSKKAPGLRRGLRSFSGTEVTC